MDNTQGDSATSPVEGKQVPIERVQELTSLIHEQRAELNALKGVLGAAVQGPRAQPRIEDDSPQMKELKEQSPVLYAELKKNELRGRQLSAATFSMHEEIDRMKFLNAFGEEGKKLLPQIEQQLDQARRVHNNHTLDRGQIYLHLRGVESLKRPTEARKETPTQESAPSSSPAAAASTSSQTVATKSGHSIEEFEAKYANEIF